MTNWQIYNKLYEDIPELKKMLKIARKLKIPIDITWINTTACIGNSAQNIRTFWNKLVRIPVWTTLNLSLGKQDIFEANYMDKVLDVDGGFFWVREFLDFEWKYDPSKKYLFDYL